MAKQELHLEIDGKGYELKYSSKRVKLIEASMGESILGILVNAKGCLSLQQLETCIALALKEVDGDVFVAQGKGREYAEALIENEGYSKVLTVVMDALQRDCPFFFQSA